MTQWSEHSPHMRRSSLPWEEGTTVVCSPSWLSVLGNGKRTKLEGQEKCLRSSFITYTKAIGVCTGPRFYLSVNNDNYTQCSQDQKGRNNKRKETERDRESLN